MLGVYMLALMATLAKTAQMAQVELEAGTSCFVALFVVLTLPGAS